MKILYILIGPKGAGKTHIGTIVGQQTGIHFLRVEPIWIGLQEDEDGWQAEEREIGRAMAQHDQVMIESLGAGEGFKRMLARLRGKYAVRLIKVETNRTECLKRFRSRDNTEHLPISDEQVMAYNAVAAAVTYNWDAVIDNNGPLSEEAILAAIYAVCASATN